MQCPLSRLLLCSHRRCCLKTGRWADSSISLWALGFNRLLPSGSALLRPLVVLVLAVALVSAVDVRCLRWVHHGGCYSLLYGWCSMVVRERKGGALVL